MVPSTDSALPVRRSRTVSTLILGVLGLQFFAGFFPILVPGIRLDPKLWPFLSYGMYSEAYRPGDLVLNEQVIVGILDDATETEIRSEDVGMQLWNFRAFAGAIKEEDMEAIRDFVAEYEQRSGLRVTAVRLESYPILVARGGPTFQPRIVLKRVEVGRPGSGR